MKSSELTFTLYQPHHYPEFKATMELAYPDLTYSFASEEDVNLAWKLYPRGQIVCLCDGKVVGINYARIVPFDVYSEPHKQHDCINLDRYVPEAVEGDSVYGIDVCVHPDYQNLKIGQRMVEIVLRNAFEDNFYCVMGNSRVVNYPKYSHEMGLATYAAKVQSREIHDPSLSFHFRNGMEYVNVNPDFSDDDHSSGGHGVTLAIYNPNFDSTRPIFPERRKQLAEFLVPVGAQAYYA